ncbi:MAG: phage major capsid protein [Verrucomicrobiota bacterium]|nr:phage major capsid protein [Verrucomicrobiota bacterium]
MKFRKISPFRWLLCGILAAMTFAFLFFGMAEGTLLAFPAAVVDDDQLEETAKAIKAGVEATQKDVNELKTANDTMSKELAELKKQLDHQRKLGLASRQRINPVIQPGKVSDDCAKFIGATFIIAAKTHGKEVQPHMLKWAQDLVAAECSFNDHEPNAQKLREYGKACENIQTKAALTTTDIPMPVGYSGQIIELVSQFGSFRRYATVYPMGDGKVNLPRLTTDPAFGFIDMSATIPEKSPQIGFVELDSKKAGGLIRMPHEIDQDSIVPLGQFLARYIARQIASWEDTTGWLADGSATYKTLEGVVDRIVDNSKTVTLTSGNTATDDVTLANLRSVRALVDESVLGMSAYYCHPTFESLFASFNSGGSTYYIPNGSNGATLDGFPIRWVNKLPVLSASANVSKVVTAFGDMTYWYLGDRGGVRIDYSLDAFFATDEIAVRALWRFTVKELATVHMSGVRTAAS